MASKVDTWTDAFMGQVYARNAPREAGVDRQIPEWGIRLTDDDQLDSILGRPSRSRTSRSGLFSGRVSRELPDFVGEVRTVPSYLPEHGSVVFSISLTEPPDLLPPLDVKSVWVAEEPVVTPARPKDPLPRLDSEIDVLMSALEIYGCAAAAAKIQEFLAIREEDPDEPPINRESLLSLVQFLIQEPQLLPPVVSSDLDGLMEIEWHLLDNGDPNTPWGRGNGVVSLKFLNSGNIQYVALSGPRRRGQDRLRVHGEATKCEMLAEVGEFAHKITIS